MQRTCFALRWLAGLVGLIGLIAACGSGDATGSRAPVATITPAATAGSSATPTPSLSGELNVFAAASLTDAFNEIGGEFTKAHPGTVVKFNFAASTALRTQLEQGARGDVFASADQIQMDLARRAKVIDGPDQLVAKNKLVVIVPQDNPAGIATIQDLAKPKVRLVLTDRNVPIGAYARTALERMSADPSFGAGFSAKVLANLKSEEANVRAVVTKVQLGEADAAIVYASDVTPAVTRDIRSLAIPDHFNIIATYPIAAVRDAPNPTAARAFIDFARSSTGQNILKQHNFIIDTKAEAP